MSTRTGYKIVRMTYYPKERMFSLFATEQSSVEYFMGKPTKRKTLYGSFLLGPLSVFRTLRKAKSFVNPCLELCDEFPVKIFRCIYTPSADKALWDEYDTTDWVPSGTAFADEITLFEEVK